jgi:hypothetical protein
MRDFGRDYDKWLDANDHDASDYYYEFQDVHEKLLENECNPHDYDVFMDSLVDCDINVNDLKAAIALGESGYEQIGKVIWRAVYERCNEQAKVMAKAKLYKKL